MKTLETICIMCPMGCNLSVRENDAGEVTVEGNLCPRGRNYGIQELKEPKRVVTSLLKLTNGKVISCKTADLIPKESIGAVLKEIKALKIDAPVKIGDVLAADIAGTGVDLVATKGCSVCS